MPLQQGAGDQGAREVALQRPPGLVEEQDAVAVPIQHGAQQRPGARHRGRHLALTVRLQRVGQMRGKRAVGGCVEHGGVQSQPHRGRFQQRAGGTVGGVQHHLHAAHLRPNVGGGELQVGVQLRCRQRRQRRRRGRWQTAVPGHRGLDLAQPLGIAHRAAAAVVELEAVVLRRIVGRGSHHAGTVTAPHLQVVQRRGAGTAGVVQRAAGAGGAGAERAQQLGRVGARVAAAQQVHATREAGEGAPHPECQGVVDLGTVDAPYVVRLERIHRAVEPVPSRVRSISSQAAVAACCAWLLSWSCRFRSRTWLPSL